MRKIILASTVAVLCTITAAQEQKEEPATPAQDGSAVQATQTVEREVSEEADAELDTFNPSEKINVDSSVSFPVDI